MRLTNKLSFLGLLVVAQVLSGCLDRFETISAYQDMRFLCSPEMSQEFDQELADCYEDQRAGVDCNGIFSLRGHLDGQPITLEARLLNETLRLTRLEPSGELVANEILLFGQTPYFDLRVKVSSLGFALAGEPKTYRFKRSAIDLPDEFLDDLVLMGIRLSLGSGGNDIEGIDNTGFVTIQQLTQESFRGSFEGAFGSPADIVVGCMAGIFSSTAGN